MAIVPEGLVQDVPVPSQRPYSRESVPSPRATIGPRFSKRSACTRRMPTDGSEESKERMRAAPSKTSMALT